ncbi:MAG: MFS transporter [Armatimonadetes bacterium]|nr:MFS transporter [Armatimonadota bacterium]
MAVVQAAVFRSPAARFILLLGIVSLGADMTYEGARSIAGPFLAVLGASATAVGVIAGLGELIGYGLRLASGHLADRTGRYWTITVLGYALNLAAVPLLALAGRWEVAAGLIIAERVGKAIRTPARDAMLSHAAHAVGRGWAFGVHEALDQIGAVLGPLLVAAVLATTRSYPRSFAVLLVPAVLALGTLGAARRFYPHPRALEPTVPTVDFQGIQHGFWLYLAAVACIAAGFADFPLMAFHLARAAVAPQGWIPLFYALAMGVDAVAALVFGRLFDRRGLVVLVVATLLSSLAAPLVFLGGFALALAGVTLWGVGMGAQESIMRAAIASIVPPHRRGSAYGLFNAGYGVAWFAGSALMGVLYDRSVWALVAFSVTAQMVALPLLLLVGRHWGARKGR